jgi:hypothetical protein
MAILGVFLLTEVGKHKDWRGSLDPDHDFQDSEAFTLT